MVARQIQVFGKVQGVWYRKSTQIKAHALNLNGTVQNLLDGSVLIYVEGEVAFVDQLQEWCRTGSKYAEVSHLEAMDCAVRNLDSFEIIR